MKNKTYNPYKTTIKFTKDNDACLKFLNSIIKILIDNKEYFN